MNKLTKIVATIGPASDKNETIHELIDAGVNVFRFNMKHGTVEWHRERIELVQRVADQMKVNIGILIDLQGPEIRLETKDKNPITVKNGDRLNITPSFREGIDSVCIPQEIVFQTLKIGDVMLIDDGLIELKTIEVKPDLIVAEVLDGGVIGNRKGVNFPGIDIDLPSLIEADLMKLDMATSTKVDFIALSFSRTKHDIEVLRSEMAKRNLNAAVVAKIESMAALEHLDDLIEVTDGVMVARGDLGVEVPIEQLAYWQKIIITKCREASKPVITATQMLQSMTENARPTRAEATDVANAVLDGTDAVMLSGETASGKYPTKAVKAMSRIAAFNETISLTHTDTFNLENDTEVIVAAAKQIVDHDPLKIKAIVVFSNTGYTVKAISRLRPKIPIIALTEKQSVVEQLTLSYGVRAFKAEFPEGRFEIPTQILNELVANGVLEKDNLVVIIHGQHWNQPGQTNAVALIRV